MQNAFGYVIMQVDGRCLGLHRNVSIKADIDILPNIRKAVDTQFNFHVVTEGIEIGADWPAKATQRTREM